MACRLSGETFAGSTRNQLTEIFCQIYYLVFGGFPYSSWGINPTIEARIDVFRELPPDWEPKWEQMRSDAKSNGDTGAGNWKLETASGFATGKIVQKTCPRPRIEWPTSSYLGIDKALAIESHSGITGPSTTQGQLWE
jgi:hypothetical protein